MKKTIVILAIFSVFLSGCAHSKQYGNQANSHTRPTAVSSTAIKTTCPPFEPMEGYDLLQTVFLVFDKNTTSEDVISTLNAAGLYYYDQKISGNWYFEIAYNEPVDRTYGINIYDTDTVEVYLRETDDDVFLIESMTYYFYGKGVKAIYDFDRGYSAEDLEKAAEAFAFVDTNVDTGYTFPIIEGETRQEILDLGIEYKQNKNTEDDDK